jgi:alkylation response protein AidB-like acyl-CoA dehydrogenase
MDLNDSPEEARFRSELREFLALHSPGHIDMDDEQARDAAVVDWHRTLYDAGYFATDFPTEYGGRGLSPLHDAIVNDEVAQAGAPDVPSTGYLARAVLLFGSEAQKKSILPGLLSGRVLWCQGFSEPSAGSDLAGISTRAYREGETYRIRGHKIWTSKASRADHIMLLARTDEGQIHKSLSFLLLPMDLPGIIVRPIRQLTGSLEFNEVIFEDVLTPANSILGAPGEGWRIAMTTLAYERGPSDAGYASKCGASLRRLEEGARSGAIPATGQNRRALAEAYVGVEVLRVHVLRSLSRRLNGDLPGADGSVDKLLTTRVDQQLYHAAIDVLSPAAHTDRARLWLFEYLYSRGTSIAGGTTQIQLNIVAERLLGLPRS